MRKSVNVGKLTIGGGNPISVQSMTNTETSDFEATKAQLLRLQAAGCDVARLAVNSDRDVAVCKKLVPLVSIPLVADIQFDYRLAIASADAGFAKIRFNPGNIGSENRVKAVVDACKANHTPIRIGVNAGSLDKQVSARLGFGANALVESVCQNVALLEKFGFTEIVLSAKSSDVTTTIETYRRLASFGYPLHVGVTESGYDVMGMLKSAVGIGSLLIDGIGDTIRVSLTGDPVKEIEAARAILKACNMDKNYCEIVSCPTCSRCKYDLESIVKELTDYTKNVKIPLKIAAMGCVVNGPGEAREADFGFAGGGDGVAVLFEKGVVIKKITTQEILPEIKRRIDTFVASFNQKTE